MKKVHLLLTVIFIFSFVQLNAQNYDSQSRFSIFSYGGIGFAKIENTNEPNYNLNVNSADFLIHYRIGKAYGIATGIGLDNFSGNGFNSTGSFYHERNSLRIPLLGMYVYQVSEKVKVYGHIGVYARTISSEDFQTATAITSFQTFDGWNFGMQSSFGLGYNLTEKFGVGLSINNQGDFTNIESIDNAAFNNEKTEQKTKGMYTVGLTFSIGL